MASEILISYGDKIVVDQSGSDYFEILWADKGNAFPDIGNDVHYVIYNTAPGGDEVQRKDPSTHMMTGNTALSGVSAVVGNGVTVQQLLDWGETRKGQIDAAITAWTDAGEAVDKTWRDYDSNYS